MTIIFYVSLLHEVDVFYLNIVLKIYPLINELMFWELDHYHAETIAYLAFSRTIDNYSVKQTILEF